MTCLFCQEGKEKDCLHCGDSVAAGIVTAQEELVRYCARAKLTSEEYHIVLRVGLSAVKQARILAGEAEQEGLADQQEYIYYLENKVRELEADPQADRPASCNILPI